MLIFGGGETLSSPPFLLDLNFLVVEYFCFLVLLYAVSNCALTSFCVLDLKLLVGVGQ